MALTALTYQNLILVELEADSTELIPAPTITDVQGWWPTFDYVSVFDPDIALVGPHLQYLYTKRKGVEAMMGNAWQDTTVSVAGEQLSSGDLFKNLKALYDVLTGEIDAVQKRSTSNRPGAIAAITTTAPNQPLDPSVPDPNDSFYRGDPLKPVGFPLVTRL